jgi:hypothetical protein
VGVRWDLFPRDAAQFVKRAGLPAPVLNSFDVGGYLDWAWNGDPPTFIDGRVFGENPVFADLDALENAQGPEAILERYGIRTILLRSLFYDSGRLLPIVPWLLARPDWTLVRATDALVFTRAPLPPGVEPLAPAAAWRAVLWEVGVKESEGTGEAHLDFSRGIALLGLGDVPAAKAAFSRAVGVHPEWGGFYAPYLGILGIAGRSP